MWTPSSASCYCINTRIGQCYELTTVMWLLHGSDSPHTRLLRSAGLRGQVTVTWEISPGDTTVFGTISDTVVFTDGQAEATAVVQVSSVAGQLPVVSIATLQALVQVIEMSFQLAPLSSHLHTHSSQDPC